MEDGLGKGEEEHFMYDCLGNRRLCRSGKVGKGAEPPRRPDSPTQCDVVLFVGRRIALVAFVLAHCRRRRLGVWVGVTERKGKRILAERTLRETFHAALSNEAIGRIFLTGLRNPVQITVNGFVRMHKYLFRTS
jgi:hypothetical protein